MIFIVGLFLPWQQECGSAIGEAFSHQCISFDGWTSSETTTASVLALALTVAISSSRLSAWVGNVAVAFSLLVATAGFELEDYSAPGSYRVEFGYGATISFVGAAVLVVAALARVRLPQPDWPNVPERIAPVAACLAYLAVLVVPWWGVLPRGAQSALRFAPVSWLTIAGALVGIHLLFIWLRPTTDPDWFVALPLFLLALAAVDLIAERDRGISWGGGGIVSLCLVLAFLGNVERRGGIRNLRIPELLRVDRIE